MKRSFASLGALVVALIPSFAFAQSEAPVVKVDPMVRSVEVGTLVCTVLPNSRRNYIVRSTAQIDCVFSPVKGEKEMYRGVTGIQLGIDLTVRESEQLGFAVLSSRKTGEARPAYALEGKYFGATATASLTYGIGASALIGGTNKQISLQPVGIETLRGLGVGAGLGYLYLERVES